jgi:hypothetical protein
MEARAAEVIPCDGERWQYEPTWDGFRCLAFKSGDAIDLRAKCGKPFGRYFPEVASLLRDIRAPQFVVDGELVIESEGGLAFDVLQMRLHPVENEPDDRLVLQGAHVPGVPVTFHLAPGPANHILAHGAFENRRKCAAHTACWSRIDRRPRSELRLVSCAADRPAAICSSTPPSCRLHR